MSVRAPYDSDVGPTLPSIDKKLGSDAEIALVLGGLPHDTRLFLQILSGIRCKAVPHLLFQRACQSRYYWHTDGTLLKSEQAESLIPLWLHKLVSENERGQYKLLEDLEKADPSKLVLQTRSGSTPGLILSLDARQKLLEDFSQAQKFQIQIAILTIVAHSFPEPYTDIVWQDIHARLWEVVYSTCLPFLNDVDVTSFVYVLESTSPTFVRNLFSLVNCVKAFTPCHCLRALSYGIRARLFPVFFKDYDDGYYQLLPFLSVHEAVADQSCYRADYGRLLRFVAHQSSSVSRRYKAALGLATAVHSGRHGDDSILEAVQDCFQHWIPSPHEQGHMSEMEWLAYLPYIRHPIDKFSDTYLKMSPIVLALAAFSEKNSENYEEARTLLELSLPWIKETYGASARETSVVATEYMNASNILCQETPGRKVVLEQCSILLETSPSSAESCTFNIALADSFIGCSDYVSARTLLAQARQCTDITDTDLAKIRLRELGMCRRSTVLDASTNTDRMLHDLVGLSDAVSEDTQHAIMKEIWCTTSMFHKAQFTDAKNLFEGFLHNVCMSVVATTTSYKELGWRSEVLKQCFEDLLQGQLPTISDVIQSHRRPTEQTRSWSEYHERYRAEFKTLLERMEKLRRADKTVEVPKRASSVLDGRPQYRSTSKDNNSFRVEEHDALDADADVRLPTGGDTNDPTSLKHKGVDLGSTERPDEVRVQTSRPLGSSISLLVIFRALLIMNQADTRCLCPTFLKESVLTLDGGGVRGFSSLLILNELMKEVLAIEHKLDDELDQDLGHEKLSSSGDRDYQLPLPCHYFNYIFGTGTGGIIALLLGRLRLSLPDCLNIYQELCTTLFCTKSPFGVSFNQYSHKDMEKLIKKALREHFTSLEALDVEDPSTQGDQQSNANQRAQTDLTDMQDPQEHLTTGSDVCEGDKENLNDLENLTLFDSQSQRSRWAAEYVGLEECRVGVIATRRGTNRHSPHLFRSYRNTIQSVTRVPMMLEEYDTVKILNLDRQDDGVRRIKIWEAARATSALPGLFRRIKVDFVEYMDGGLVADNPSWLAWYEASSMHVDNPWGCRDQQGCIRFSVSLGTGKGASRRLPSDGSIIHQVSKLYDLASDRLTDPEDVHKSMSKMVNQFYPGAGIYSRFNVPSALRMMEQDECEKNGKTFTKISEAVQDYLQFGSGEVRRRMKELARQLVEHRRSKCRAEHQRYQGLSTPGPIDPRFLSRFLNLHDIRQIVRDSRPDTSVGSSDPHGNTLPLPNTVPEAQERNRDGVALVPTTSRRRPWGKRREAIYVYDYSKDKIKRIEDGGEFRKLFGDQRIKEVPIPLKPGRLPIRLEGPENVVAFVRISAALRYLRLIGAQKMLYVVAAVRPVPH